MTPHSLRTPRLLVAKFAAVLLSSTACGADAVSPGGPELLAPLATVSWVMVEAEGQPLPAVVAHRLLDGNILETSVLESATLIVNANGSYEQAYRIRTLANGVQQSNVLVQDCGEWTAGPERYELSSDTRVRSFRIDPIVNSTLRTTEAMVFRAEAGLVRGRYVPIAPAIRSVVSASRGLGAVGGHDSRGARSKPPLQQQAARRTFSPINHFTI